MPTTYIQRYKFQSHSTLQFVLCKCVFGFLSIYLFVFLYLFLSLYMFSLCASLCLCISLYFMCFFFPFMCASLCVLLYLYVSIPMPLSMSLDEHVRLVLLTNHAKTLLHAKGNCVWGIIDHISFSSYVLVQFSHRSFMSW